MPVHTHGDPVGVKLQGGQHEIITRDIEIECLPEDIPETFNARSASCTSAKASALPRFR